MNTGPAIAVALTFVWLGMVLAISFLEAPLKFRAPDVTLQRIYLETMERILGGSEKLIYDGGGSASGQGIVPYLPLGELTPRRPAAPTTNQPAQQTGATR